MVCIFVFQITFNRFCHLKIDKNWIFLLQLSSDWFASRKPSTLQNCIFQQMPWLHKGYYFRMETGISLVKGPNWFQSERFQRQPRPISADKTMCAVLGLMVFFLHFGSIKTGQTRLLKLTFIVHCRPYSSILFFCLSLLASGHWSHRVVWRTEFQPADSGRFQCHASIRSFKVKPDREQWRRQCDSKTNSRRESVCGG